jgi:hypothetical protein
MTIEVEKIHDPAFGPEGATLVHISLDADRGAALLDKAERAFRGEPGTIRIRPSPGRYLVPT